MSRAKPSMPRWCFTHDRQYWVPDDRFGRGGICPDCKEEDLLVSAAARELRAEGVNQPRMDQAVRRAEEKAGRTFKRFAHVGR